MIYKMLPYLLVLRLKQVNTPYLVLHMFLTLVLLLKKAKSIDKSLIPSVEGSIKAIKSNLEKIQGKFFQASKKGEEQKVNQIKKLSGLIHQNGKLKERSESFIADFIKNQDIYIEKLKASSNSENNSLKIIVY